ncbi:MAG: hypothetical protein RL095_867 [Verrucomicrobiota bacterium]|jgi:putative hemolysin
MNHDAAPAPLLRFSIDGMLPVFGKGLLRPLRPFLDRMLGLDGLNRLYGAGLAGLGSDAFIDGILARLDLKFEIDDASLARIPATGPVLAIANHPLGALDGIILSRILKQRRQDAKVMANAFLNALPEIRDELILVDSFRRGAANGKGLRQSVDWLKSGHCLGMFPAGAVSRFDLRAGGIADAAWSPDAFRIARMTGATVVPLWFSARNSTSFYILGALHPMLRTMMLPRELARRGQQVRVQAGAAISPEFLAQFDSPDSGAAELRRQVEAAGK